MKAIYTFPILLLSLVSYSAAFAEDQVLDDQDIFNVENLYKNPPAQQPQSTRVAPTSQVENAPNNSDAETKKVEESVKIERLTDLNTLSPFREVSIIQKKYLPKTERFQFFAAGGMTTNSPWFLNLGVKVNIGYFFTESFGLEVGGMFLSNSERDVSKEIRENNNLQPEKFVNTKSHMGVDLIWSPIYGKVTFLNERIILFDMYFSGGVGTSTTNSQEKTNTTFHVGTGQIFALSKSMAFRWDYSWNMYQATPIADSSLANSNPQSNTYNDLILTAGLSFFFPEVSSR
jgi:outer membrane beta-barrel protein